MEGRWLNSQELREGDVLFLRGHGESTVRWVSIQEKSTPVCNLTVAELHTFAVGQGQVLVHNSSASGKPTRPANPHIDGETPVPGNRNTGVRRAGRAEVDLVQRKGSGTVDWTPEEIEYIKTHNKLPPDMIGHHINNVEQFPDWAGDPRNIKFVRGQEANLQEHGGKFQNPTTGPLLDRSN